MIRNGNNAYLTSLNFAVHRKLVIVEVRSLSCLSSGSVEIIKPMGKLSRFVPVWMDANTLCLCIKAALKSKAMQQLLFFGSFHIYKDFSITTLHIRIRRSSIAGISVFFLTVSLHNRLRCLIVFSLIAIIYYCVLLVKICPTIANIAWCEVCGAVYDVHAVTSAFASRGNHVYDHRDVGYK